MLDPIPDESWRFCIHYRQINPITIRDTYPLPRMDHYIDSLGKSNVLTNLDENSGYWKDLIHENSREKTNVIFHSSTYRFKGMPFGLINAPETTQRTLYILLSGFQWKICPVYIEDVIIFSQELKYHMTYVDSILSNFVRAGGSLKMRKCDFFYESVKYLGHIIRRETLSVNDIRVMILKSLQHHRTIT